MTLSAKPLIRYKSCEQQFIYPITPSNNKIRVHMRRMWHFCVRLHFESNVQLQSILCQQHLIHNLRNNFFQRICKEDYARCPCWKTSLAFIVILNSMNECLRCACLLRIKFAWCWFAKVSPSWELLANWSIHWYCEKGKQNNCNEIFNDIKRAVYSR